MSSEAELVLSIWEAVREVVPHTKRADLCKQIVYAFAEFGFDGDDLESIMDEDAELSEAYQEVFVDDEIDEDEE